MANLKKIIKAKGWTISALAGKLGITQSSLSVQINANTMPINRLEQIALIIGCEVGEFFTSSSTSQGLHCPKCGAKLKLVEDDEQTKGIDDDKL